MNGIYTFFEFQVRPAQTVRYQACKQHACHGSNRTFCYGYGKGIQYTFVPEYGFEIIQSPYQGHRYTPPRI